MKYQVIYSEVTSVQTAFSEFTERDCINNFTILAETKNKELATKLADYWRNKNLSCVCEVHPIMDKDEEIIEFLEKNK